MTAIFNILGILGLTAALAGFVLANVGIFVSIEDGNYPDGKLHPQPKVIVLGVAMMVLGVFAALPAL